MPVARMHCWTIRTVQIMLLVFISIGISNIQQMYYNF